MPSHAKGGVHTIYRDGKRYVVTGAEADALRGHHGPAVTAKAIESLGAREPDSVGHEPSPEAVRGASDWEKLQAQAAAEQAALAPDAPAAEPDPDVTGAEADAPARRRGKK